MKLHLPKGLFIAVLAAISSILSTTFGADTISVNFTGSENKQVTASSSGTLGDVDYTGWNNIACSVGTSTLKDNNGDDQAATLVLGYDKGNSNKNSMGSYRSATNSNGTVTGDVQRGYIDVWNTGENHYTISLTHDYWVYDAIFYMSGDTAGVTFAPMEVNGTAYIGGTDVLATDANKAWGSGYTTGCTEYTDNNRVTVTSQIGHTLLATNVWNGTTSRATLAGLQVVDRTAETVYFTTLGSGETTTADASWSLNGAAAMPYADISAEAKYLGVVADAAGSTLKVDAGDSIKFLGVKENALTVVSDGSVSVERIITEANTSLNIAAGLTGTRMDIYGDGTLTISGDASAFSGALYVHGGELIIKNDTTKFGLGSTIINDGSLALRSDVILHTDKNKLVTQLRDSSGNVVNGFAGDGYTLNRLIATGTGSVALQEGSKVYYGTGDTTGSTLSADSNSIFVLDSAESGVYYVSSGQSVNIGSVSLAEGQTLDKFSVFGTLNINSTTLPGRKTLRQLLTTTVGTGTIELSQSANLQNGDEMAFEGKLVIKSGADLRIGIDGTSGAGYSAQGINLSKLDSIELAGGTLSTRFYSGNLGDILVSSNSTLHAVDITATNGV
ncbi:MAG: hypothetical protein IKY92_09990, partial [Akkermansia sp.]|nr:hypothetical protein [Akkermansia sp.]